MVDLEARTAFAADPAIEGLAAARIAVEHLEHHGRPLHWVGSSYLGDVASHRFRCRELGCRLELTYQVTGA